MFATIWMCTQEWSLISIRATAFTFETCHHALSFLSSFTSSISERSLRLPRTGTLIFIRSIASAGVSRVSAPPPRRRAGRSGRRSPCRSPRASSEHSLIRSLTEHPVRLVVEDDLQAQPLDGLLPADPRDPASDLGRPLDDRRVLRGIANWLVTLVTGRPPGAPPLPQRVHPLPRAPERVPLARREPVPRLRRGGGRVPDRRSPARAGSRRRGGRRSCASSSRSRRSCSRRPSAAAAPRAIPAAQRRSQRELLERPRRRARLRVAVLGWFASVVRGQMPKGLRDAGAYSVGYGAQILAYLLLVTDRYPNADPTAMLEGVERPPQHPVHLVGDAHDLRRSRVTVFFRLLLALPHLIWLALWGDRGDPRDDPQLVRHALHAACPPPRSIVPRRATFATSSTSTRSSISPRTRSRASPARPGSYPLDLELPNRRGRTGGRPASGSSSPSRRSS